MFYRLKSDYVLRGWNKNARVLVKRPENWTKELTEDSFRALLLCDGETDLDEILQDARVKKVILECQKQNLIEPCESPKPLDQDQYYKYYDNRYVREILWSITGKCNYRCRHCYMDAPNGTQGEISTEQALNFIDQMAECGVLSVSITGGEPFVRRDFWQLIDRILSYKIVIGKIYTNGWFLNEKVLNNFEERGIKPNISISFDGIGWHDWMRGVPGAEEVALRALQLCKDHGFATDVEMCIHRGNKDTLPQTIKTLCAVGVTALKTSGIAETDLWRKNSDGNSMTWQEYQEAMIPYISEYFKEGCPLELMLGGVIYLHMDGTYSITSERHGDTETCLNEYLCGGARWSSYITPEGRLLPCMPMTSSPEQYRFPKIQDIGLKQGLSDSFYMSFIDKRVKDLLKVNKKCAACKYKLKCGGGCRASALLDGEHNLMGCDSNTCMMWKAGYVERIRQVAEEARAAYELCKAEPRA